MAITATLYDKSDGVMECNIAMTTVERDALVTSLVEGTLLGRDMAWQGNAGIVRGAGETFNVNFTIT